jgi:hypothetical protein
MPEAIAMPGVPSPNIEFFRTVLGIDSDAPSFKKVKIVPHLGNETKISGSIPHPSGNIATSYKELKDGKWKIKIDLPKTITRNTRMGKQKISIKRRCE